MRPTHPQLVHNFTETGRKTRPPIHLVTDLPTPCIAACLLGSSTLLDRSSDIDSTRN